MIKSMKSIFKKRIENAKRFSDGKIIISHTDLFKMICIE